MTDNSADVRDCVFCAIVAGDSEANWEVGPGAESSRTVDLAGNAKVVSFHNRLKWARIMLLVIPTEHMTQKEFWSSSVLVDAARLAVDMGDKHCADDGYRVISNFGKVAHQSQDHAHLHVVSGISLLIDDATETSDGSKLNTMLAENSHLAATEYRVEDVPFAVKLSPVPPAIQREMWRSQHLLSVSQAAAGISAKYSPDGFRLISSFDPRPSRDSAPEASVEPQPGSNPAGLFLFGGGQLGLYV